MTDVKGTGPYPNGTEISSIYFKANISISFEVINTLSYLKIDVSIIYNILYSALILSVKYFNKILTY